VFEARLLKESSGAVGEVAAVNDSHFVVSGNGGSIQIVRVRADGGKESAADYAARSGLKVGDVLGT